MKTFILTVIFTGQSQKKEETQPRIGKFYALKSKTRQAPFLLKSFLLFSWVSQNYKYCLNIRNHIYIHSLLSMMSWLVVCLSAAWSKYFQDIDGWVSSCTVYTVQATTISKHIWYSRQPRSAQASTDTDQEALFQLVSDTHLIILITSKQN